MGSDARNDPGRSGDARSAPERDRDSRGSDPERTLDVREIDGEPFGTITAALDDLPDDERLLLVNSFEPEPLYGVLEERGYGYETERAGVEEWHVVIGRRI